MPRDHAERKSSTHPLRVSGHIVPITNADLSPFTARVRTTIEWLGFARRYKRSGSTFRVTLRPVRRDRRTFTAFSRSGPAFAKSSCQRPFLPRTERASGESMIAGKMAVSLGSQTTGSSSTALSQAARSITSPLVEVLRTASGSSRLSTGSSDPPSAPTTTDLSTKPFGVADPTAPKDQLPASCPTTSVPSTPHAVQALTRAPCRLSRNRNLTRSPRGAENLTRILHPPAFSGIILPV